MAKIANSKKNLLRSAGKATALLRESELGVFWMFLR